MKISTKGRYAIRAMLDLALHYGQGPVLLKDIAKRQEISEQYLEHLMIPLKAAGLVKSLRGARGGFTLAKPPSQVRMGEVLQVLEGIVAPVECVAHPEACSRSSLCAAREVWVEIKRVVDGVLESTTLEDLAQRQREKEQPTASMYYI